MTNILSKITILVACAGIGIRGVVYLSISFFLSAEVML